MYFYLVLWDTLLFQKLLSILSLVCLWNLMLNLKKCELLYFSSSCSGSCWYVKACLSWKFLLNSTNTASEHCPEFILESFCDQDWEPWEKIPVYLIVCGNCRDFGRCCMGYLWTREILNDHFFFFAMSRYRMEISQDIFNWNIFVSAQNPMSSLSI